MRKTKSKMVFGNLDGFYLQYQIYTALKMRQYYVIRGKH